eukprot:gnl/TRDRNA2_/TRDRNA2_170890_c0_seq1.p1 gnl/TRDRNA2_/TRDRNA2_170890_c0~~gnl/TRDRNA2_/TRDRNA2_170890_c0_seq1.p1  ORF type:complete len:262 (+),score=19.75 gnl/TRDRNA2_/TRDRNA2_170890_c0_seq1:89-874(+)
MRISLLISVVVTFGTAGISLGWPLDSDSTCAAAERSADPDQALSPGQAYVMYKHLHLLQEAFERSSITYWAIYGTLLGAVRNGGIIKHEDDLDICVFEKDLDRIRTLVDELGMRMTGGTNEPLKIFFRAKYKNEKVESLVDLFVAERLAKRWEIHKTKKRNPFRTFLTLKQLENDSVIGQFRQNLRQIPFGCSNITVASPEAVKRHLDDMYGLDWDTTVSCRGNTHECKLPKDPMSSLTGMALPCYHPNYDYVQCSPRGTS